MLVSFEWSERLPPNADEPAAVYRITLKSFTRLDRGKRAALLREGRQWFADETDRDAEVDFTDLTAEDDDLLRAVSERALMIAAVSHVEKGNGEEWEVCPAFWDESIDEFLNLDAELWDSWFLLAADINKHLFVGADEDQKKVTGVREIVYSTPSMLS